MNEIHEPESVEDAKNAIAYFGVLAFIIVCSIILFGGMISPCFYKSFQEIADGYAKEQVKAGMGSYEKNLKTGKIISYTLMGIWFVAAWTAFVLLMLSSTRP